MLQSTAALHSVLYNYLFNGRLWEALQLVESLVLEDLSKHALSVDKVKLLRCNVTLEKLYVMAALNGSHDGSIA